MRIETTPVVFKVFFKSLKKKKKSSVGDYVCSKHPEESSYLTVTPTSISLFFPDCCITPSTILISFKLGVEMSKQFLVKTF